MREQEGIGVIKSALSLIGISLNILNTEVRSSVEVEILAFRDSQIDLGVRSESLDTNRARNIRCNGILNVHVSPAADTRLKIFR